MSNAAEWIDFATLVVRTGKKPRTLRRMIKERQISSRQRIARGKREFNWGLVERELALLDDRSAKAPAVVEESELRRELSRLSRIVEGMAAKMGIDAEGRAVA